MAEEDNSNKEIKKLGLFFELVPEMLCIASAEDGYFKELNPAWEKTLGFTIEELLSKPLFEFIHPDDRASTMLEVEKQLKGQPTISFSNRYICKDGSYRWLSWTSTQAKGNLLYATARDITEHKKAKAKLKENEDFLYTIIENIPDMIFVKDADDLRFVRFNRAGEELLGHSRDSMLGKNDYDLFPKDEADFFTEKDRDVLKSGHVLEIPEEYIQTKNRGTRVLHTKKIPVLDKAGRPQYLLGISEDITERKKAEEVLMIHHEHLEKMVRERTRELEEKTTDLEKYNKLFADREYRIKELRDKVKELEGKVRS